MSQATRPPPPPYSLKVELKCKLRSEVRGLTLAKDWLSANWNWNLPAVFGWRQITFWQAIGLFALCRILFGDLGMLARGSHRSTFRRRMAERWGQMTPEEREKFRQGMRSRCGDFAAPTSRTPAGETRGPA